MGFRIQPLAGILILLFVTAPASAQTVAGAALERDVHRFSGDPDLNRLNGGAAGWLITAGVQPARHLVLHVEMSSSGTIADAGSVTVDLDGRSVTVTSTVSHRLRAVLALAGYSQQVTTRVRVAYLAGVAFSRAERTFTTNAADAILVSPSTPDPAGGRVRMTDDFVGVAAGANLLARTRGPLALVAGIRVQSLRLESDLSGFGIRPFGGVAWVF
jgi:hypothetical protein